MNENAEPPGGIVEIHSGEYRRRGRRHAKYLGASARRALRADVGRHCCQIPGIA